MEKHGPNYFFEPKLFGFSLLGRFQSGEIMPIRAHSSPAPVRLPPRLVSEVHRLQDGLKSSFDSHFVIEEIPSKRDMASNHELEVIQCTTKIKAQVPLSSSGGGLNLQSWTSICFGWRFWYLSYEALSGSVAERGNHPWR
ncbi:hypothetical protein ACFX1X_037154 [Malus domestica]